MFLFELIIAFGCELCNIHYILIHLFGNLIGIYFVPQFWSITNIIAKILDIQSFTCMRISHGAVFLTHEETTRLFAMGWVHCMFSSALHDHSDSCQQWRQACHFNFQPF